MEARGRKLEKAQAGSQLHRLGAARGVVVGGRRGGMG